MSKFFGNHIRPVTQHDVEPAPPPSEGKESVLRSGSMALAILKERSLSSVQGSMADMAADRLRR